MNTSAIPQDAIEEFYPVAEQLSGFSAQALKAMALMAYEHRANKPAQRVFSFVWGRNSRNLARAVARWPRWFWQVDGQNPPEATPDDILALFYLAALPREQADRLYKEWQRLSLKLWQVKERAEEMRISGGKMTRVRLRSVTIAEAEGSQDGCTCKLEWKGPSIEGMKGEVVDVVLEKKEQ